MDQNTSTSTDIPPIHSRPLQNQHTLKLVASLLAGMNSEGGFLARSAGVPGKSLAEVMSRAAMDTDDRLDTVDPFPLLPGRPDRKPAEGPATQDFHPGHCGLDIHLPVGSPVRASMTGNVIFAGASRDGYGNLVVLQNGPYQTWYAHLSHFCVKPGDAVSAGQLIAHSGNSGNTTGPHLHYEVRFGGQPVDPAQFLGKSCLQ